MSVIVCVHAMFAITGFLSFPLSHSPLQFHIAWILTSCSNIGWILHENMRKTIKNIAHLSSRAWSRTAFGFQP